MELQNKMTSLWSNFFKVAMPQIRAFHMTWFAFFVCFFAWFGIAPLMSVVRDELGLTRSQIGLSIIASVAATVIARVFFGWLCDRIGPRLSYTWLLILGSVPVMAIGLAQDPLTFIFLRLLIGVIGASFVITQYHTSVMFAPNVVGTANATTAGWGNMGGGITQLMMPLIFTLFVAGFGFGSALGWRLSMLAVGIVCLLMGIAYFFLTQDTPDGNFKELRAVGKLPKTKIAKGAFVEVCKDHRVWALSLIYGCCFGIELTICNIAALYFADYFELSLFLAGAMAFLYGGMNVFARPLGGMISDTFSGRVGLRGRVMWLFMVLFCEGLTLMFFSQMRVLTLAIPALMLFGLFVQMSNGATFSVVPFVNNKSLGTVAGIVGAGGNVGAVAAGLLFTGTTAWPTALLILGGLVTAASFCVFAVTFSPEAETAARKEYSRALAKREQNKDAAGLLAA
ncbi:MAG: MFS transporter [Planctomycetaceae bacterium]|nr:MFS transporter [Planctomycetaceae bacterium]